MQREMQDIQELETKLQRKCVMCWCLTDTHSDFVGCTCTVSHANSIQPW